MKSHFLFTVFVFMFLVLSGIGYMFFRIPPVGYFLYLLLFLFWVFISLFLSVIFYKFSSSLGHESDRQRFRRQFKKAIFIGFVVILLLIIQRHFDIIQCMSKKKSIFVTGLVIVFSIFFLLLYIWFLKSPYFDLIESYAKQNLLLFIIFLVLIKFVGLVYPPIAGGYFILASIPIIGWFWAFVADIIGSTFGGSVNYFVARKYGIGMVRKIVGDSFADKVEKIKIKKGREIEGLIFLRIFIGFTVIEMIHYAAGILQIDFKEYTIAMVVSHVLVQVPIYYLFGGAISSGSWIYLILFVGIGAVFLYKNKGRYLE